jgi:hypothetical protein
MLVLGLYTGYERRSILVFLVIKLILLGFLALLGRQLRNASVFLRRDVAHCGKLFSNNEGILQAQLCRVVVHIIWLAKSKNMIGSGYQSFADTTSCLAALAPSFFCRSGCGRAVVGAWKSRYVKNRQICNRANSMMKENGQAIERKVAATSITNFNQAILVAGLHVN